MRRGSDSAFSRIYGNVKGRCSRLKRMNPGKRLAAVLLCVLFALSGLLPAAMAEEGGEELVVGVPVDRCPMIYVDADTKEIAGIGADLMRAAAQNAGYDVRFRQIAEETLKEALDNPAYDLLMPFGSAIQSAAGRASVVSGNLIQTPFTLVTEGNRNLPPLTNLRVGMLRSLGGVAETVRQRYPGIVIDMYETTAECVKALREGKVDALLHNSFVWSYVLQKPAWSDLRVQPSAMFSMDFCAGALDTPENRALIARLNEGIAALSDTRRQAVALDYTSRRLYRYDVSDYLHEYGLILLLCAALVAGLAVFTVQRRRALRREHEAKLRELMEIDPLTGALNMNGFRKRAEALLRAHPDIPYLITYNNIRNFKFINDSLGRAAGDELLRFWAERIRNNLTPEEAMCRVTADRFAVLRRLRDDEKMRQDEAEIIEPVRKYFTDRGKGNLVQICNGIYVLTPEDYRKIDVDRILDCARVAEQRVRDTRKDGYLFYNPEQWRRGKQVADVCGYLPIALQSGELEVWYQPQVNYETGEIVGAEALCRWNHPRLGWLRPAEFIPILEDAGLIYDLDCYVWERVCRDLQRWKAQGLRRAVSVNLSRCDIREDRNIPGRFLDLIQTYGLSPEQLRIEITESAFAENPNLLIRTTDKLRELGFQVEMDDFGSGYSSLHMLKEVPVDRIKLDLHFLSGAGDPERGRIIVSHVVQMVRSLGMKLIAEGVETASQAEFLRSRGCAEMQGFYFCKPLPVQEFETVMKQGTIHAQK